MAIPNGGGTPAKKRRPPWVPPVDFGEELARIREAFSAPVSPEEKIEPRHPSQGWLTDWPFVSRKAAMRAQALTEAQRPGVPAQRGVAPQTYMSRLPASWWQSWNVLGPPAESYWPADIVEKALGQGMYKTMRREGEIPERWRGVPKAESEYGLYALLQGLEPERREWVLDKITERTYSGPEHLFKMATRLVDEAIDLPAGEREEAARKIMDEEQHAGLETVGSILWDPLLWASYAKIPVSTRGLRGRSISEVTSRLKPLVGRVKLPKGVSWDGVFRALDLARIAQRWAGRAKVAYRVVYPIIDDIVRLALGVGVRWSDEAVRFGDDALRYADEAVRYRTIAENLEPEAVKPYLDRLGLSDEQKDDVYLILEETRELLRHPPRNWTELMKRMEESPRL